MAIPSIPSIATRLSRYFEYCNTHFRSLLGVVLLVFGNLVQAQQFSRADEWVVSVPLNFPPYYSINGDENPDGFAIDVFEAVAARAGIQYRYEIKHNWEDVIKSIRAGKADIVPNMGVTKPRAEFMSFTSPAITFSVSLFARKSNSEIQTFKDLAGRRVAVISENTSLALLNQVKDIKIDTFSDIEIAFYALISGQVDALAYPEPVMWNFAQEFELADKIRVLSPPLGEIKRAIAVRSDLPELQQELDIALRAFLTSEQYNEIYQKWFSTKQIFWDAKTVFWFMSGLMVLLVIVLTVQRHRALLKLNATLQQQIEDATSQLSESNAYLQDLTVTDALTGISNRRAFENSLQELMERANRYQDGFSMLIFDIDNFKLLNDRFGHDMGDRVLKDVVDRIAEIVRNVDILSRWGGEEFTILMPRTNRDGAMHMAERCRSAIADELFDEVGPVTISLGVTCYQQNDNERKFFKRADDALYKAKSEGKNKVVWNGEPCKDRQLMAGS